MEILNINQDRSSGDVYPLIDGKQVEIDEIFSLLAYSIVYADWQDESTPRDERRGYNIGSVLVDSENNPVFWGLNSVGVTNNATQHSEVRLMTQYLDVSETFDLKSHTVYTTLEPCAMCGGMMAMALISKSVFGQNDVEFSHAIDRLNFDSRSIGGYAPFPRKVACIPSPSPFTEILNESYQSFLKVDSEKILAKFLVSNEAKNIYSDARNAFETYKIKHIENQAVYNKAKLFYKNFLADINHNLTTPKHE
ncbi:cytidine/deoxycytidylate deaminase-like protein [Spirosoma oryzae]|uniref:Cytidine/deoxycytidylate deaminase-like protein n=1 Tax=Spirosoma oryzae TaxID=1469603 RepID=A0A2T0RHL3_9BACT|nr:deaminase [Spirosoma oryzae]PRY20621.1 cytidine/deoxycytidylate deaminase-like protein [Spirosoma oryzae]